MRDRGEVEEDRQSAEDAADQEKVDPLEPKREVAVGRNQEAGEDAERESDAGDLRPGELRGRQFRRERHDAEARCGDGREDQRALGGRDH